MNEMLPIPTSKDYTEPTTLEACDREYERLEREITMLLKEGLSIKEKGQERAKLLRIRERIAEQTYAYNLSGTLMKDLYPNHSDENDSKQQD